MTPTDQIHDAVVVGAGLAGLTAAYRLAQAGWKPLVFERYAKPGGLARVVTINGERLEAFYHHIFTSDTAYIELAEELGLGSTIEWLPSRMGIFTENRLWDFGTPMSLLKFKPLPWPDKVRFVLQTLYLQHKKAAPEYDDISAERWIRKHMGEAAWRTVWGPLLHQKFADIAGEIAMVWLWRKIYVRGRSRSASGLGERLGYMNGSFALLVEALAQKIQELGGRIQLADPVHNVSKDADGLFRIHTRNGDTRCRQLLAALPVPDYLEIAGSLLPESDQRRLATLRATSALCTVLELDRQMTSYYWLNIADKSMPFGGLIEQTNFVARDRYGGSHVLYISNYLFSDNPLYRASKTDVIDTYLPGLRRINPAFDPSWIIRAHHFRADYAQPVISTGYRHLLPETRSAVSNLYLCSMAQVYPEDRGQNFAVLYGDRAAHLMIEDAGSQLV